MIRALRLLCLFPLAALAACYAPPRPVAALPIPPGRYAEAFDLAREATRELRFDLERVDARMGVLSTRPKPTSGLATPWDLDQSTFEQEIEDLVQEHTRRVRIVFTPPASPTGNPAADPADPLDLPLQDAPVARDLLAHKGGVVMRVLVTRTRTQRPHWQLSPASVRSSTFAIDPARGQSAEDAEYPSDAGIDRDLATRLIERVRLAMDLPRPRTTPAPRRRLAPDVTPPPVLP
jgi:hypothetical protein